MTALASAQKTAFGDYELTFPFCQALVDDLKTEIPARYRKWDPDDRVWRILGAYAPAAIDLLLEYFPNAEIPGDHVRPGRLMARTERPAVAVPLPSLGAAINTEPDRPELDHLTASVRCPKCRQRYDQPIRAIAEASLTVAKRETITPELISVCPSCNTLAVVAFFPAVAGAQEAS